MDLQGKVIAALDPRSGESARGPWKSQDFVIETHDTYPRKMMFTVFGEDRLLRFNIQVGQEVNVSFDINAREYNGRWYNDIRAYDVRLATAPAVAPIDAAAQPFPQATPAPQPFAQAAPAPFPGVAPAAPTAPVAPATDSAEDLPF